MNNKQHIGDNQTHSELEVFEQRVRRYQSSLFAYLGRFGFPIGIAEELAQETFLRAWRADHQFDEQKSQYSTWLFRIARNVALTELDKQRRTVDSPNMDDVANASTQTDGAQRLADQQQLERLSHAMSQLSLEDQETIALSGLDELSSEEAAVILDCSAATYRTRLSRARSRLKKHWETLP